MDPSSVDIPKQDTRTFLRERFLRMMASINGQEASINMYQKAQVQGVLRGIDIDVQTVHVSELNTPIGVLPEAYLRLSDVKKITIEDYKTD